MESMGDKSAVFPFFLDAPDRETARKLLAEAVQEFATVVPKAIENLRPVLRMLLSGDGPPEPVRHHLRTTNAIERLNRGFGGGRG